MSNVETVCTATHASNEIAVRSEDEVECSMVPSERAPTIQRRTMTDGDQSLTRIYPYLLLLLAKVLSWCNFRH